VLQAKFQAMECLSGGLEAGSSASSSDVFNNPPSLSAGHTGSSSPVGSNGSSRCKSNLLCQLLLSSAFNKHEWLPASRLEAALSALHNIAAV